jgi:hypothetical protein
MSTYAYRGLPVSDGATVVSVTEDNLLPALVLWLFFTTNPDYLSGKAAGTLNLEKLASDLGLSADYVKQLFAYVKGKQDMVAEAATLFQNIFHTLGAYQGPDSCGKVETLSRLAPLAKKVWTIHT